MSAKFDVMFRKVFSLRYSAHYSAKLCGEFFNRNGRKIQRNVPQCFILEIIYDSFDSLFHAPNIKVQKEAKFAIRKF